MTGHLTDLIEQSLGGTPETMLEKALEIWRVLLDSIGDEPGARKSRIEIMKRIRQLESANKRKKILNQIFHVL